MGRLPLLPSWSLRSPVSPESIVHMEVTATAKKLLEISRPRALWTLLRYPVQVDR